MRASRFSIIAAAALSLSLSIAPANAATQYELEDTGAGYSSNAAALDATNKLQAQCAKISGQVVPSSVQVVYVELLGRMPGGLDVYGAAVKGVCDAPRASMSEAYTVLGNGATESAAQTASRDAMKVMCQRDFNGIVYWRGASTWTASYSALYKQYEGRTKANCLYAR
ncbi:hypothetical protein [Pseudomonas sp. CGJS7]|uniref:hypothetical protein n=1 Tax=Pseudomonas sp. CGJS7 TaxID=3109348 RepID=UPI0030084CCC